MGKKGEGKNWSWLRASTDEVKERLSQLPGAGVIVVIVFAVIGLGAFVGAAADLLTPVVQLVSGPTPENGAGAAFDVGETLGLLAFITDKVDPSDPATEDPETLRVLQEIDGDIRGRLRELSLDPEMVPSVMEMDRTNSFAIAAVYEVYGALAARSDQLSAWFNLGYAASLYSHAFALELGVPPEQVVMQSASKDQMFLRAVEQPELEGLIPDQFLEEHRGMVDLLATASDQPTPDIDFGALAEQYRQFQLALESHLSE